MVLNLNLGCPYYCKGYQCVDLHPKEYGVIQSDAIEYLRHKENIDMIYSKNLLEHLTDIDRFLSYSYNALKTNGKIMIITDNAEFIPYYFPFWLNHTGIGAHSKDEYAHDKTHNSSHHYMLFTKMHMRNLLERYNFKDITVKRIMNIKTFGARLKAEGIKP